jgi:hypothetical protein
MHAELLGGAAQIEILSREHAGNESTFELPLCIRKANPLGHHFLD